jgi:hypothetical protein
VGVDKNTVRKDLGAEKSAPTIEGAAIGFLLVGNFPASMYPGACGMSQRQAAKLLGVAEGTIRNDLRNNNAKSAQELRTGSAATKARRAAAKERQGERTDIAGKSRKVKGKRGPTALDKVGKAVGMDRKTLEKARAVRGTSPQRSRVAP